MVDYDIKANKKTSTHRALVIVESPTKAKTISKFLGSEYQVESSFGHIRDLPKSKMGVDIENDFAPQYIVPLKSKKTSNAPEKDGPRCGGSLLCD